MLDRALDGAQLYALLHRPGVTGLLTTWLEAAVEQAVRGPHTMALATSDAQGRTYRASWHPPR